MKRDKPEAKLLAMVTKLIGERSRSWDPAMVSDPVQEQLLSIISAKKKGRRPAKPKAPAPPAGNVVNIMDALRKSIQAEKPGGKRS
jgi:DNA end-binding protein Ku